MSKKVNLETLEAFSAIIEHASGRSEDLLESIKDGLFKDFEPQLFQEVVNHYLENKSLPKMYCEDVQLALKTSDKQNYKVLSHLACCQKCRQ